MGEHEDEIHAVLSDRERSRFVSEGTGSDASDRWLHAIMGLFWVGFQRPWSLDTPEGRRDITGDGWRRDAATMVNAFAGSVDLENGIPGECAESCGEPMIVNAMDTIIRFAMTRHDVTGPLCGGAGPDAARMMERTIKSNAGACVRERVKPINTTVIKGLVEHMLLPVIVRAGSCADDVFDAISAGYMMREQYIGFGITSTRHPLSSCIPYEGPHCGPRLAAMWADGDAINAMYRVSPLASMAMTVTSMPGAADIGIPAAVQRICDMDPDYHVPGVLDKGINIGYGILAMSLSVMSWDSYLMLSRNRFKSASWLQFVSCIDEDRMVDDGATGMDSSRCADPDRNGTWTRFISGFPAGNNPKDPAERNLSMSDSAFILENEAHGTHDADPTLAWDLLRAVMYPRRYPGCGIPRMDAVAGCHRNAMYCEIRIGSILDAAIQMHDGDMLAAYEMDKRVELGMWHEIYGDEQYDVTQSADDDRDHDADKLFFLDLDSLELFFRSISRGMPEMFAMETLLGSIRSFNGGDRMPPDAHGIITTTPYDHKSCMVVI